MGSSTSRRESESERLFHAWLEEQESGRGPTFEELRGLHPEHAERLETLRVWHARARVQVEPDEASTTRARHPEQPSVLGTRYESLGELAHGGMGTILEVRDPSLDRTIALKMVRSPEPSLAARADHARYQSRLLAEARVLARLDHPGVVPIHEVGLDAEGRAYFTMKRVEGHDFEVVIRAHHAGDKRWRMPSAVAVLRRVCEAVDYAHSKGVIHRDLKPTNVMVGRFGEVFVMDWGLAKVAGIPAGSPPAEQGAPPLVPPARASEGPSASPHARTDPAPPHAETQHGSVLGTPAYMAPEQARGEIGRVDARSDVYAIGAMLYHLLAGRPPYDQEKAASSTARVTAILAGPPETLARQARHAPEELVAVAEKAMQRDPGRRYGTVHELAHDLDAWLEGRVVRAHRTGAWVELLKWVSRNRGAAAAFLAVVGGLLATATIQAVLKRDLELAHQQTEARAEELRREDTFNRVALASAALANGDISHMRELLSACPEDLRAWEWRYLARASDTSVRVLQTDGMDVKSVSLLDDGRTLLTAGSEPARILVSDLLSGRIERELELPANCAINTMSLSADGALLAVFGRLGDLRLWETRGWQALASLDCRFHGWHGVAFAPSGRRLAAYGTEGVELWDVERRASLARLSAGQKDISDVAWSTDGRRLFAASWDGSVSVWDTDSAKLETVLRDSTQRVQQVECSPDGRWLAGGNWDSRVLIWEARTLALVHRSDRVGGHVLALAWSPDSALLAVGGKGVVVPIFEAGTWEPLGRLVGHTANVQALCFAPGGRTILSGSSLGSVRSWDLERLEWRTAFGEEGREPPAGVVFSGDGARVAVGWGPGQVEIWNVHARARERRLQSGARIRHLDWSRDGSRLALADWEQDILLIDPRDPTRCARLAQAEPTEVHFDRAGTRLAATAQDGFLRVWDVPSLQLAWQASIPSETQGWPGNLFGASWSPEGTEIVASSHDGRIQVRDAATGALRRETSRAGMIFTQFCHDGQHILASAYADNRGMELLDAQSLAVRWTSRQTSHMWPVLSPDCRRVFSANWRGLLGVWDARAGRLVTEIEGLPPGNPRLGVAPDGACVVLAAGRYLAFFDARAER